MDFFKEKLVKRKTTTKTTILKMLILLATSFICVFSFLYVPMIGPLIIVAAGYGAWYLTMSFNIEYEYIVTNGELDIDKIVAKRKRSRLINVHSKNVEIIAPVNDEYKSYLNREYSNKYDFTSGEEGKDVYFVVYKTKEGKNVYLTFEPSEDMLKNMKTFNPRNIII